jgi:PIN domain nuclease of toxin-antitoxin system
MKLDLNTNQLTALLAKYRNLLALLAVGGLFVYTAHLVSQISNVIPDASYIDKQKQAANQAVLKIDLKTVEAVKSLQNVSGDTGIPASGKTNPFN